MTVENPRGEPKDNSEPHEIRLGVSFKPFGRARRFCRPGEGFKPFGVPEPYTYTLALRRQMMFYGMQGVVDVITDYPESAWESVLVKGSRRVEKPLGETHFEGIFRGPNDEEFTEQPTILRFGFLVRNPSDYSKLLYSYADVKLGEEQYLLVWNQNRPAVKRDMQLLEEGQEILVVEKNLFNVKEIEQQEDDVLTDEEKDEYEKIEFGRVTFVWLPKELRQLRTIELTFNKFGGGSDQEQPTGPVEPEKERIPSLV